MLRSFVALTFLLPVVACGSDDSPSMEGSDGASTGAPMSDDAAESSGTPGDSTGTPSDSSGSPADSSDGGPEATGEELYTQLCSSCHGPQAEGSSLGYELRHPSREYARWVIRNGRSGNELAPSVMTAYPESALADADVDKIFDYLDSFPQPTTGEDLYGDYCRACHGTDASGGESQKNIRNELNGALQKCRQGEGGTNYGGRTAYMPSWTAAELSDDEVASIVSYIGSL